MKVYSEIYSNKYISTLETLQSYTKPTVRVLNNVGKLFLLYRLYDSAIGNLLGLTTLRHGTSIYAAAQITRCGAKASFGGKGGECGYYKVGQDFPKVINKIYVWNDHPVKFSNHFAYSSIKKSANCIPFSLQWGLRLAKCFKLEYRYINLIEKFENSPLVLKVVRQYLKRFYGPFHFSHMANTVLLRPLLPSVVSEILGYAMALVTPTVKFRFTPEDFRENFEADSFLPLKIEASFIRKDIDTSHIGISGSLIQGLNSRCFSRIKNNPVTFALGIVQIVSAIALTVFLITSTLKVFNAEEKNPAEKEASVKANSITQKVYTFKDNHPSICRTMEILAKGALIVSTW